MVITPDPELEAALTAAAQKRGVTPDALALEALRQKFLPRPLPFEPQDEWERGLLEAAIDCGVPHPDTTYSREEIYD
jgi:hypothetical protein